MKDLGKDVFSSYPDLRASMVSTKALVHISNAKVPEREPRDVNGIVHAEKLWMAIASEYALYPRNIPSKFPFVLPYFQVLERCMEIEGMLKPIIRWNASHMRLVKPVTDLFRTVREITHDPMVLEKYRIIVRTWSWFEEIRNALKISREMSTGGSGKDPVNMEAMERELNRALSAIREEGEFTGGELERVYGIFRNRIENHREELLSPVTGKNGNIINVVRHNGIEEIGHRWSRMHIRRRTGRSQTAREMGMFGALTAVLSNIENNYYNEKVLSGIDFLKEFVSVTEEEMDMAGKLIRSNPCEHIIRNDRGRLRVLHDLVKILETHEELPAEELKAWVESIKI